MLPVSGQKHKNPIIFLCLAILVQLVFWFISRPMQAKWINTPPVPDRLSASFSALGDDQFAYRLYAMDLQNMGDEGGRATALKDYDFERLGQWFHLLDNMDSQSNYVPLLAAYYFGSTQNPLQLTPVIDYLAEVGRRGVSGKWRWLVQAIFLARHRQGNIEKGLYLSEQLANLPVNLPVWARQMNLIIKSDMGDKATAQALIIQMLKTEGDKLPAHEVNFLFDILCNRLQNEYERQTNPVCKGVDP